MFLFWFVLAILALIGNLIFQIIRYFKVKANAFSRKEVKAMALQKANELSYVDPEITCDYCGCKFNTLQHKVCPNCGAAFHKDEEWVLRHGLEEDYVDETTDALIAAREEKAKEETAKILAKIRKTILILVIIIAGIFLFAGIGYVLLRQSEYRGDEKLNDNDYENFVEADYEWVGDGVLYDQDDVRVTLQGVYVSDKTSSYMTDDYEYDGTVRFGLRIENNRDEDISLAFSASGINGLIANSTTASAYDKYRKHKTVLIYEEFHHVPYEQLEEMVVDRIAVHGSDYTYHNEVNDPLIVKTTATCPYHTDYSDRELVYTDELVDIYGWYVDGQYHSGYRFAVVNKSDKNLHLRKGTVKLDGVESDDINIFYSEALPAGYTIVSHMAYELGEENGEIAKKQVEVNIAVECPSNPSLDFSTGYFDVSKLDETMVMDDSDIY